MTTAESKPYDPKSREFVDSTLFKKWLVEMMARPGMSYERLAKEAMGGGVGPSTLKRAMTSELIGLDTMDRIVMGQGFMLWELGY